MANRESVAAIEAVRAAAVDPTQRGEAGDQRETGKQGANAEAEARRRSGGNRHARYRRSDRDRRDRVELGKHAALGLGLRRRRGSSSGPPP